ncbi:MAG: hypothetical protein R2867_14000 [Caldilineaceae bacterium]
MATVRTDVGAPNDTDTGDFTHEQFALCRGIQYYPAYREHTYLTNPSHRLISAICSTRRTYDTYRQFTEFVAGRLANPAMLAILLETAGVYVGYALAFDVQEHPFIKSTRLFRIGNAVVTLPISL